MQKISQREARRLRQRVAVVAEVDRCVTALRRVAQPGRA